MRVAGMTDYDYLFQNYRVPEIPKVSAGADLGVSGDVAKAESGNGIQSETHSIEPQPEKIEIREETPTRRAQDTQLVLSDISLSFHKEDDYSYIGSEKDLAQLDVQKAISDMKKDSILQNYQYFVGSAQS